MATKEVVEFIGRTGYGDIPPEAIRMAKRCMIDTLGVALAGSMQPEGRMLTDFAKERQTTLGTTVIAGNFRTSADTAAFANGTMAHALDFDDTSRDFRGHPSGVMVPTIFALGERYKKSGRDTLCAFATGFEVGAMIGDAMGDQFKFETPWHLTSTVIMMGAVAAGAKVAGLDEHKAAMALGIASSLAGGLKKNVGTMTKPLHAGRAARDATVSVLLADEGLTASEDILEVKRGFYNAFTGLDYRPGMERPLGDKWSIISPSVKVKAYPCCGGLAGAIYAMLELRKKHGLRAEDVAHIESRISQAEVTLIGNLLLQVPETIPESRFTLKYAVAIALLDGEVTLRQFTDQKIHAPETKALMDKVTIVPVDYGGGHTLDSSQRVTVTTKDGRTHSYEVAWGNVKGNVGNPMTDEEISTKFRDCASFVLSPAKIDQTLDLLWHLEVLDDVGKLMQTIGRADLN